MSWREHLKPASFAGVPFFVESVSTDFGRNIKVDRPGDAGKEGVLSKYKTTPTETGDAIITDMGSRETEYLLNIYFIGDEHTIDRARFEEAFKRGGAQTLILPLEDPIEVFPNRARRRWSNKEGGIEFLEVSFLIATSSPEERVTEDTAEAVYDIIYFTVGASTEVFEETFTIEDAAPFVVQDAEDMVTNFADVVQDTQGYGTPSDTYEDWLESLDLLALNTAELIRTPERLVADIVGIIEGIRTAVLTIESAFSSQLYLFENIDSAFPDIAGTSDNRTLQRLNRAVFMSTVKITALSQMALYSSEQSFDSREEALERRDVLLGLVDSMISQAGEGTFMDSLFDPLQEMRAAIVKDMSERAANLPSIINIVMPTSGTFLSVCYDIYGTLEEYEDLLARNSAVNPNFCPTNIEVVSP